MRVHCDCQQGRTETPGSWDSYIEHQQRYHSHVPNASNLIIIDDNEDTASAKILELCGREGSIPVIELTGSDEDHDTESRPAIDLIIKGGLIVFRRSEKERTENEDSVKKKCDLKLDGNAAVALDRLDDDQLRAHNINPLPWSILCNAIRGSFTWFDYAASNAFSDFPIGKSDVPRHSFKISFDYPLSGEEKLIRTETNKPPLYDALKKYLFLWKADPKNKYDNENPKAPEKLICRLHEEIIDKSISDEPGIRRIASTSDIPYSSTLEQDLLPPVRLKLYHHGKKNDWSASSQPTVSRKKLIETPQNRPKRTKWCTASNSSPISLRPLSKRPKISSSTRGFSRCIDARPSERRLLALRDHPEDELVAACSQNFKHNIYQEPLPKVDLWESVQPSFIEQAYGPLLPILKPDKDVRNPNDLVTTSDICTLLNIYYQQPTIPFDQQNLTGSQSTNDSDHNEENTSLEASAEPNATNLSNGYRSTATTRTTTTTKA